MSGPVSHNTGQRAIPAPTFRLGGDSRLVEACAQLALVREAALSDPLEADIVTTWRDWPGDDARRDSGIVVVLGEEGGRLVKAVRGSVPAGMPLDISIDLSADKTEAGGQRTDLLLFAGDDTAPGEPSRLRLRTDLRQRVFALRWRESCLTLTLETGRVYAWPEDGRFLSRRIGLATIRLDSGDAGDMHDFALHLAAGGGIGPMAETPEQAGRALLREEFAEPVRARRYDLPDDASAADVYRLAIGTAADQVLDNVPALRLGRPEGIKQMRIGLRRLRALVRAYRQGEEAGMRDLVAQAKHFARILGGARDLDVFVDETLPAIIDAGLAQDEEADALEALRQAALASRQSARRAAMALAEGNGEFARFCVALSILAKRPLEDAGAGKMAMPARHHAARMLDRRLKKVRRLGDSLADAPPHARHPLRVELKKLRYAVQAVRPLYAKDHRKPYMTAMAQLQDAFGAMNDAVIARKSAIEVVRGANDDADKMALEAGAGYVIGWTQRGLVGQADTVLEAWRAFAAMTPFWQERKS